MAIIVNFNSFREETTNFYNNLFNTSYTPDNCSGEKFLRAFALSKKDVKYIERYLSNYYVSDRNVQRYAVIGNNDLEKAVLYFLEFVMEQTLQPLEEIDIVHATEGNIFDGPIAAPEEPDYTDENMVIKHAKFGLIKSMVEADEPVFLTGPAGSGKNVICKQIADELGLKFYFTNAVTQEYKITGFTDAMGVFHESQFYKAFKDGGIFFLDEMDASIPEALVILNAAIANRYFDFPAPIGFVKAHPDFRVIAAGNTFGLGADYEYVGRNQLDAASLDRFGVIKIDYDRRIEMKVAKGNTDLVNFVDSFRSAASKAGVRTIVSYRAIGRIASLEQNMSIKDALMISLVKNLQKDDLQMIIKGMPNNDNKYYTALKALLRIL